MVTGLDLGFLEELRSDYMDVRRHDIAQADLEPGAIDLMHARAVLMQVGS